MISAAQAKRDRAALMRAIEREIKQKNRARLLELRRKLGEAVHARRAAIRKALADCKARKPPTFASVHRELQRQKKEARITCDLEIQSARDLRDRVKGARAELDAEQKYQREIRRIERANRAKDTARALKRSSARERRGESDDEVRGNIPPELVSLWERVKRQIKGSDRMSRTEAFLHYAEEHPDEQWQALEDRTDEVIRQLEARERGETMANPKKKKRKSPGKKRARAATKSRKPTSRKKGAACNVRTALERQKKTSARLRRALHEAKHRRANPRRPPRRWFDACLASVSARRYARDPAAVCGAAWWKLPPKQRAAIVRRLERGGPRQKRAAVAIAKAEQRRADRRPPRKRNGPMSDDAAVREYERTHWGDRGSGRVRIGGAPNPAHGTATKLGRLVAVTYRTKKKGDRELTDYEHEFEGSHPTLAYNDGGLLIVGGDYRIAREGIEG